MYLDMNLQLMQLCNGIMAQSWVNPTMSMAVRICKDYVTAYFSSSRWLPKKADAFSIGYYLALEVSPALGPNEESYYQSLMGVII